ncbi:MULTISPECIES: molecular chaperone [Enterobacter]|uniref:molecular chaperone n=1 Tax=Enterobacter TaxID=547 RepID=UPI001CBA9DBD|nr:MULTISPECIES: molecular chaperone [Enterobacter]UAN18635.1 molecular chaperone [Enterobacter asburiae]UAN24989.1 molecular chaperone [Enterobacter sp. JBIWA003]
MTSKKDMLARLANVAKNAPLQETSQKKETTEEKDSGIEEQPKKTKVGRKPKNLQIPEDLWDAYDALKAKNATSLLMTPYILEAFREKLARDGAFDG